MAEEGGTGEGRGESRSQRLVLFAGSRIPQGCRSQVTPEYKQFLIIFPSFLVLVFYMPVVNIPKTRR